MASGSNWKSGASPERRGASLTEYGDVDAGRGALALDVVLHIADVVSTLGHGGAGEEVEGARLLLTEEVVRLREHVDHLEGRQRRSFSVVEKYQNKFAFGCEEPKNKYWNSFAHEWLFQLR